MGKFLRTKKDKIITYDGKSVVLKGVNLGGWLMMEAYMMYAPNFPARKFKSEFEKELGRNSLKSFEKCFRDSFVEEKDIKNISRFGFNCIRVPFNYSLIEKMPYKYDKDGIFYLDKIVKWARKYKLWVILDLHAACGCQNHDWHSDSYCKAELWTKKSNQKRTYAIWEFIADRYKDEECVAGYDLLNEAVLDDTKVLNGFYKRLIKSIRKVDKNHILFIEGNKWAMDIDCLEKFDDGNYVLSIHHYIPLEFTFNFIPNLNYPLKSKEGSWSLKESRKYLSEFKKISQKRGIPIFVGEFGVNARQGYYGEDKWLDDTLRCFKEFDFHWTYWTYKAVKNSCFPDGVFSYYDNPAWVNRVGPLYGWDTYKFHWKSKRKEMSASWKTDQFKENKEILKVLKKYAK